MLVRKLVYFLQRLYWKFFGTSFSDNENGKNKCAFVYFIWDGIKDSSNVLDTPWAYQQKQQMNKQESDANTQTVCMSWVPGREFPIPLFLLCTIICGGCQAKKNKIQSIHTELWTHPYIIIFIPPAVKNPHRTRRPTFLRTMLDTDGLLSKIFSKLPGQMFSPQIWLKT